MALSSPTSFTIQRLQPLSEYGASWRNQKKVLPRSSPVHYYAKLLTLLAPLHIIPQHINSCWEWTAGLGAPAALVAGAVLVTLSESRQDLTPRKKDRNWVRVVKQLTRFLLLSSFALEVVSIFVSTVTGSVLLSHGEVATAAKAIGYTSPLGLLYHHHEFEYLTIQMGFLQGLIHWLGAVGLELMVPKQGTWSFLSICLPMVVSIVHHVLL